MRLVLAILFLLQASYAQPRRIVSTSPGITETLFALGLGPRVVGVSNYCRFPPEVLKLPKVGTYLKPDAELIARLSPDLVFIHKLPNDLAARLAALGIPTAEIELGTLPKLYVAIETVGKAAGVDPQAKKLIADIQTRLNNVRQQAMNLSKPKVLFIVGRRPGTLSDLVVVGTDSFLNELIRNAGGINVLDQPSMPAYPRISLETVIRLNPDFILDTATPMGDGGATEQNRNAIESLWQEQKELTAARSRQIRMLGSEAFVVPGPRVVEVVELLFGILHPQGVH
jgi:iron complex transport system substrate-binding protein